MLQELLPRLRVGGADVVGGTVVGGTVVGGGTIVGPIVGGGGTKSSLFTIGSSIPSLAKQKIASPQL
jgi:hypothetical protein